MLAAHSIVKQLIHCEVRYFCIAPGSRSTPLVLAAAEHPLARTMVHFDERGLAFHALGYAKATGKPAAIVVTSGTAVGNLLPAVMEARASRIPLLLLTADRPPESHDCGANQTCPQWGLFGQFVEKEYHLATDQNLPLSYYGGAIAEAVARAKKEGPIHINCPFREPFVDDSELPSTFTAQTTYLYETGALDKKSVHTLMEKLMRVEKGVVLLGEGASGGAEIAQKLQWPLLADPLSKDRTWRPSRPHIPHYDLLLDKHDWKPEAVLHLGGSFVSKAVLQWLAKSKPPLYVHVAEGTKRQDPTHQVTHRVSTNPAAFAEAALSYLPEKEKGWLSQWEEASRRLRRHIHEQFEGEKSLSEAHLFHTLEKALTPETLLFTGNGMAVRAADAFFFPGTPVETYGNRGISGIDGLIATATGLAVGKQTPILAILGDQSFLHDLNSLAMLSNLDGRIVFFVINNGGGQLFSFLPIAQNKEVYGKYFAAQHAFQCKQAASLFGLRYTAVRTMDELVPAINETKTTRAPLIVEIFTEPSANVDAYRKVASTYKPKSKLQCLFEKSAR